MRSGWGTLLEYFFSYNLLGKEKIGNMLTGHFGFRYLRLYGTGIRLISFKLMMLIYPSIRGNSTTTWTEFCHFLNPPPHCVLK